MDLKEVQAAYEARQRAKADRIAQNDPNGIRRDNKLARQLVSEAASRGDPLAGALESLERIADLFYIGDHVDENWFELNGEYNESDYWLH